MKPLPGSHPRQPSGTPLLGPRLDENDWSFDPAFDPTDVWAQRAMLNLSFQFCVAFVKVCDCLLIFLGRVSSVFLHAEGTAHYRFTAEGYWLHGNACLNFFTHRWISVFAVSRSRATRTTSASATTSSDEAS